MSCTCEISKGSFHCAQCHRTFGTVSWFDAHQSRRERAVRCHMPRGLTHDRWGVLRTPEDRDAVEAKVDAMQKARHK